MSKDIRPYLVVSVLVEQPTWGGSYISTVKGWNNKKELQEKKIGQSFELYGKSLLHMTATSTQDSAFSFVLRKGEENSRPPKNTVNISLFVDNIDLPLIKFTQAAGNSFQLHTKQDAKSRNWKSKAESWYYFEKGCLTHGLSPQADLNQYKQTCKDIEFYMKDISQLVRVKRMALSTAKEQAQRFVQQKNPWQFVNRQYVEKDTLIDLSEGGIHHSWEQDKQCPLGNVLYEIQQDVPDKSCTIRSFDQGKLLEDGSVREIQIDEYFSYIDTNPLTNLLRPTIKKNGNVLQTPHYSLDVIKITKKTHRKVEESFHHLFVRSGSVCVSGGGVDIIIERGHSCFIPKGCSYEISTIKESEATILVAHMC